MAIRRPSPLDATAKPDREATFLRLLVQTRSADAAAEVALRRAVRTSLGRDVTGRAWRVARLFSPTAPLADTVEGAGPRDALATFFEVTGRVSSAYPLAPLAFELAYRLQAAGRFRSVQPDLPSSAYDLRRWEARQVAPAFAAGAPLPGSGPKTWALEKMRCPEAWTLLPPAGGASHGEGSFIGHPDTGYALHSAGLQLEAMDLLKDYDILSNDDDARDPLRRSPFGWLESPGHGTGTGAVIVSRGEGADAIMGAAPRATLIPIRAITSVVVVFAGDVARAVDYARRAGCHVISMSLGGLPFPGLQEAIRAAVDDGLIVLAAAGNYSPFVVWPAAYPECIAVAASNADDEPWAHSSRGGAVLVSAPGESVWTATFALEYTPPREQVSQHDGTSFAVAHLAGVAALWLAFHGREALIERYGRPNLHAAFRHQIETVGHQQPPAWDTANYGVGVVDARALLGAPLPTPEDLAPARAILPAAAAMPEVDLVHAVCPELTRAEVLARLGTVFQARGTALQGQVRRYGPELVYHLTQDPAARAEFVTRGIVAAAGPVGDTAADRAPRLCAAASPSLAGALVSQEPRPRRRGQGGTRRGRRGAG